jgi:hypothetical protein
MLTVGELLLPPPLDGLFEPPEEGAPDPPEEGEPGELGARGVAGASRATATKVGMTGELGSEIDEVFPAALVAETVTE